MERRIARLKRLSQTFEKLCDVLAARLAAVADERRQLLQRRQEFEALLAGEGRCGDLVAAAAWRRLAAIAARLPVLAAEEAALRRRSAEAVLKARRAAAAAQRFKASLAGRTARVQLAELSDRLAAASLRQGGRE